MNSGEIRIELLESPPFIRAGEPLLANYRIINTDYRKFVGEVRTTEVDGYDVELSTKHVVIPGKQSMLITVLMVPNGQPNTAIEVRQTITVNGDYLSNGEGGMSDETIQLMHGSQTFRNDSSKVNVSLMRADGTDKRDFPSKKLHTISKPRKIPAAQDGYEEHGLWYQVQFVSKPGAVIMIQATTSFRGAPYNQGITMIALRDEGPLIQVNVNLRPDRNAVYETLNAFSGRGDIIPVEEIEDYSIHFNDRFISNFFDEEELEELFVINTVAKGKPKPDMIEVATEQGGVRKVAIDTGPKRRVRIRRMR